MLKKGKLKMTFSRSFLISQKPWLFVQLFIVTHASWKQNGRHYCFLFIRALVDPPTTVVCGMIISWLLMNCRPWPTLSAIHTPGIKYKYLDQRLIIKNLFSRNTIFLQMSLISLIFWLTLWISLNLKNTLIHMK